MTDLLRHVFGVTLIVVLVGLWSAAPTGASDDPTPDEIGPVQVLQSESDALRDIFADFDSVHCETIRVNDFVRTYLEDRLERSIHDSVYIAYEIVNAGELKGYAIVSDERGKYRPITFLAGIDLSLRVIDVRVLVYRENRGGEVQRSRFLGQYRGKDVDDPIRINRDIINITGATISVRALNAGVRKALAVAGMIHANRLELE